MEKKKVTFFFFFFSRSVGAKFISHFVEISKEEKSLLWNKKVKKHKLKKKWGEGEGKGRKKKIKLFFNSFF